MTIEKILLLVVSYSSINIKLIEFNMKILKIYPLNMFVFEENRIYFKANIKLDKKYQVLYSP